MRGVSGPVCLIVSCALAMGLACRRAPVTGPETTAPAQAQAEPEGAGRAGAAGEADAGGNQPPHAVFRTRPRADEHGVIAGGAAFEVTYNLCPSTDPDPGDELRFSFDFDGDGVADERGSCRVARRYEVGAYETGCTATTACVSDRQPDHKICRTFQVCAIGRTPDGAPAPVSTPTPGPTPTPSPSPGRLQQQTVEGELRPIASRDAWAFEGDAGTEVFYALDTLSSESAYLMQACVSTSSAFRDCLPAVSRDRVPCSFPPPGGLGCPRRTTMLPDDGVYYIVIGGFRFTREPGQYSLFVRAQPGIGALGLAVNDSDHPASVEP